MNLSTLKSERDYKATDCYIADTDSQVYFLFGATEDQMLVERCWFDAGTMFRAPMTALPYDRFSQWVERSQIINVDGDATFRIELTQSIKSERWFAPMIELLPYVNEDQWRSLFVSTVRDQLGIDVDYAIRNGCCSWQQLDDLIGWVDALLAIPDTDQRAIDSHYGDES